MKLSYLNNLNYFVENILSDAHTIELIKNLKLEINKSDEPFQGKAIDIKLVQHVLPKEIMSGWIFILKKNIPSMAHYHPNSIQHTVMIEGKGKVMIGNRVHDLKLFDSTTENIWLIIDNNVPHEFFPEDEDMIVISFHTCAPENLMEVKCATGEMRIYKS